MSAVVRYLCHPRHLPPLRHRICRHVLPGMRQPQPDHRVGKFWAGAAAVGMKTYIALLRGINMVGNNSIRMAELCSLCTDIGWAGVKHYIQSGNLVFSSRLTAPALEKQLEQSVQKQFGHSIAVIVRNAADWP